MIVTKVHQNNIDMGFKSKHIAKSWTMKPLLLVVGVTYVVFCTQYAL